jgi:hypothetical protein
MTPLPRLFLQLLQALVLLLAGGCIGAASALAAEPPGAAVQTAAPNGDWMSYRDAYRAMIRFEKYGKPKQLIQSHFRVVPKEEGVSLDGVRLTLTGPSGSLNLLLDAAGRAVFPFLKSAFDENARLQLNRSGDRYTMQQAVSIIPRADGIYDVADLQAACEQTLAYLRDIGKPGMQGRKCIGVRFAYPRQGDDPQVSLRGGEHKDGPLQIEEAPAFTGDAAPLFKTVTYRFAQRPEKSQGQIHTQQRPVAITAVFD